MLSSLAPRPDAGKQFSILKTQEIAYGHGHA